MTLVEKLIEQVVAGKSVSVISEDATPDQLKRVQQEYSHIAGEQIEIEEIKGVIYAFGSEIAVLRLYRKFRGHGRSEYSTNMRRWFFTPNG